MFLYSKINSFFLFYRYRRKPPGRQETTAGSRQPDSIFLLMLVVFLHIGRRCKTSERVRDVVRVYEFTTSIHFLSTHLIIFNTISYWMFSLLVYLSKKKHSIGINFFLYDFKLNTFIYYKVTMDGYFYLCFQTT